jgi:RNA polymerase sigma-70 factor (ECF subfamily)
MLKTNCLPANRYTDLTDIELFNLTKQNDTRAFETLYYRYSYILKEIARKKINQEDRAEDLVHDVFLSLYNRRDSLEIANFQAYIHKALRYSINNELRALIVRRKHAGQLPFLKAI